MTAFTIKGKVKLELDSKVQHRRNLTSRKPIKLIKIFKNLTTQRTNQEKCQLQIGKFSENLK